MRRWAWLFVGVALMISLSCSVVTGRRTPDDSPVSVTSEAVPVEKAEDERPVAVEGDDAVMRVDRDGLESLDSYRAVIYWRMESDDGTVEKASMEQAATRNPRARQFSMVSDDGLFEVIQIADQVWMGFGGDWMQAEAGDDMESFGDFMTTSDDWVSDLEEGEYEYVGRETINGISTLHYRTDRVSGWDTLFGDDEDIRDDVERATADLWIADDTGLPAFMVRFVLEMTGTFDNQHGKVTMHQEVTEINQPITIEAPAGAAVGGLPDGVPLYPGAVDVISFGTMTMFSVGEETTVEDVHAFYEEALYAADWEPTDEPLAFEGIITSTWSMGGRQLTLTITSADDGSGVDVIIMLEDVEE